MVPVLRSRLPCDQRKQRKKNVTPFRIVVEVKTMPRITLSRDGALCSCAISQQSWNCNFLLGLLAYSEESLLKVPFNFWKYASSRQALIQKRSALAARVHSTSGARSCCFSGVLGMDRRSGASPSAEGRSRHLELPAQHLLRLSHGRPLIHRTAGQPPCVDNQVESVAAKISKNIGTGSTCAWQSDLAADRKKI